MSKENIVKFREALTQNSELSEKLKGAHTPEDVVAVAKEEGFDFTAEELTEYGKAAVRTGKLSDEELGGVAGGERSTRGYLVTFAWYGCNQWIPDTWNAWNAVRGQCGSCRNWHVDVGQYRDWGECLVNKE